MHVIVNGQVTEHHHEWTVHQVPGIPGLVVAGHKKDWRVCVTASGGSDYDDCWPYKTAIGSLCESLKVAMPYAAQLAEERGLMQ
jgi:hypothetical protein